MKRNQLFRILLGLVACFVLFGCTKDINAETALEQEQVFTLTATYGSENTRVAFDSDGLNMLWQPNDCLYLIDVTGQNSIVKMTTNISEPSKTASFTSQSSVLSGNYIVVYGQSTLTINKSLNMTSIDELNNQIRLYGTLTVEDGQTSACITLSQLYAMLSFKFRNLPINLKDINLGMAVNKEGTPSFGNGSITQEGFSVLKYSHLVNFGWNGGEEAKLLIAPFDLSGKSVYFFIYGTDTYGKHITYEFVKNGKSLLAGVNYNLTFDLSQASSVSTLSKSSLNSNAYILTTPEQFRAAAYWNNSSVKYSIEADVDFSGKTYFPIAASFVYGNKHSLSNINVLLKSVSSVGVMVSGGANNLTIMDSSFEGADYVGALSGNSSASSGEGFSSCCGHNISIKGVSYVGGLVGYSRRSISNCSVIGSSSVFALGDHVGGIAGVNAGNIMNSIVRGSITVEGSNSTGGIAGDSYRVISQCGFEGDVIGQSDVGGISGYSNGCEVSKSYVKGNITGVGNIVGGIVGRDDGGIRYNNCFHIGNTTGSSYVGGILAYSYVGAVDIQNCYSYGNTSSNYGIAPISNNGYFLNNLTSSPYLYDGISNDNCNCGPSKTFLSKLSVINGEEAYSTQVWPGIDAQCPLLQWQSDVLNGSIEIPGFGNEDW